MDVGVIFKIGAVGILVSVLGQVLKHSGREEQAFLVSLGGLIIVLFWQLLDLFYVGATLGVGMLLVTLNPKKATKKSLLIDAAIAVGMSIATFLIFELALKIYV